MVVNKILGFLFLWFIFSCENKNDNFEKRYFDLVGFLNKQIKLLDHSKVKKTWMLDSAFETKNLKNLNWEKEFALFMQSDINKKAFLQSYSVIKKENSLEYNLKNKEDLPVKKIRIDFNDRKEVYKIEIVKKVENYLYSSNVSLNIITKNGKIESYSMDNNQKVIFGTMKHSFIKGEIL